MRGSLLTGLTVLLGLLTQPGLTWAGAEATVHFPRPADAAGGVVDEAALLAPADRTAVKRVIADTLRERAIPIVVVTVERLRAYTDAPLPIERFAQELFDSWGIGHRAVEAYGQAVPRNLGILLLVAHQDRMVRIQLGADWRNAKDAECDQIIADYLVAPFKRGELSAGIRAGVEALSALAHGNPLPAAPRPSWHYWLWGGGLLLALFTLVSLLRRGTRGWAFAAWGLFFGLLGAVLHWLFTSRRGHYGGAGLGGGSFGGGSFGGGFSGGGGATGSW